MSAQAQIRTKFHHFNLYDLLDRKKTLEKAYELLDVYQQKWNRTHKRGGVIASTHDTLHAIISLVPRTMEEMKVEQPTVFDKAVIQNEFFCFTNNQYIATMASNMKDYPSMQFTDRTAHNNIKKLLDAKVLVKKVNYCLTGRNNPKPCEEHPRGQGKFKLVINKDILVWGQTAQELDFSASATQISDNAAPLAPHAPKPSFQQMYSILDNSKDTKEQYKTPSINVDKASAIAEIDCKAIGNSEQGSKSNSSTPPNISPVLFQKKVFIPSDLSDKDEFFARHLFEQARVALWNGRDFNTARTEQAIDLLRSHLRLTMDYVQLFRKQKLAEFKESAYYKSLADNPKYQWKILNEWFAKKLPNIESSAVQIIGEAIQKQRENGLKNGYLDRLYQPEHYFVSDSWEKAMNYSKADFVKIRTKFDPKNRALSYYQMIMEHINKAHTAILEALRDGTTAQFATNVASQQWDKLRKMIAKAPPVVSQEQRDKLIRKFKDRLQPIFRNQIS